ncbi:MAG: hypothetical protein R2851_13710 [Caldilineaceae bacterium]
MAEAAPRCLRAFPGSQKIIGTASIDLVVADTNTGHPCGDATGRGRRRLRGRRQLLRPQRGRDQHARR